MSSSSLALQGIYTTSIFTQYFPPRQFLGQKGGCNIANSHRKRKKEVGATSETKEAYEVNKICQELYLDSVRQKW